MKEKNNNSGFIAFTSLLIISAVTLAIAMSISILGINEARNSLDVKNGIEVLRIANGCADEALYRLKLSATYSGGSLNVGDGQCTINVSAGTEDRTITVTGQLNSVADFSKTLEVVVRRRGGGIVVRSWRQL